MTSLGAFETVLCPKKKKERFSDAEVVETPLRASRINREHDEPSAVKTPRASRIKKERSAMKIPAVCLTSQEKAGRCRNNHASKIKKEPFGDNYVVETAPRLKYQDTPNLKDQERLDRRLFSRNPVPQRSRKIWSAMTSLAMASLVLGTAVSRKIKKEPVSDEESAIEILGPKNASHAEVEPVHDDEIFEPPEASKEGTGDAYPILPASGTPGKDSQQFPSNRTTIVTMTQHFQTRRRYLPHNGANKQPVTSDDSVVLAITFSKTNGEKKAGETQQFLATPTTKTRFRRN
ncbi:hypothetical protein M409DRAFT_60286 [Zasmidium cellare ATCC 36951]|uniref:Uncharacterized protein n=1 Tax=Zasmidium cellare ATCC 36951 TaxID=1080233 RepID=A0A6A6BZH7_ZASCE|nr:uncharacterized protein M409DRAFT_60286 [Zasmidium cellare ATCC 36951]KAF2160023.1 hypothetical protein M409DRAFT_60286 [Zasmidium cellare ATCC 36951]